MPVITATTMGAAHSWYHGAPTGASDSRGQAMLTVSKASHATASTFTSIPQRRIRTPSHTPQSRPHVFGERSVAEQLETPTATPR